MDSDLRELERHAIAGDEAARGRLRAARTRAGIGWPHEIVRVDCVFGCGGTGWADCTPECCNGFPCPDHPGTRRKSHPTLASLLFMDKGGELDVDVPGFRKQIEDWSWSLSWHDSKARMKRRARRNERHAARRALHGA